MGCGLAGDEKRLTVRRKGGGETLGSGALVTDLIERDEGARWRRPRWQHRQLIGHVDVVEADRVIDRAKGEVAIRRAEGETRHGEGELIAGEIAEAQAQFRVVTRKVTFSAPTLSSAVALSPAVAEDFTRTKIASPPPASPGLVVHGVV